MDVPSKVRLPTYTTEVEVDMNKRMTSAVCVSKSKIPKTIVRDNRDHNGKMLHYPRCVALLLINELIKSFSFYGVRTMLVVYLTQQLLVSTQSATMIYHGFSALTYFMCIFGAMLADSWLGKYKSILILSVVYAVGALLLASGALPAMHAMSLGLTCSGLSIIAIGYGGIMPCVIAFSGDQFVLPAQTKWMIGFFAIFYFFLIAGMLAAVFVLPIVLSYISCVGGQCYALVFILPAVIMCLSLLLLAGGDHIYRIQPAAGNMLMLVWRCVCNALCCGCGSASHAHWLDHARPTYGRVLIDDVRAMFAIVVQFVPLPIFWFLFEQHGPRWTIQATNMLGTICSYTIQPEQMQLLNPLLLLLLIPLCHLIIYPLLTLFCIRRPLPKIVLGCLLVCLAFVTAGLVEEKIVTLKANQLKDSTFFRFYNSLPCDYIVTSRIPGYEKFAVKSMSMYESEYMLHHGPYDILMLPTVSNDKLKPYCRELTAVMKIVEGKSNGFFIRGHKLLRFEDDDTQSVHGKSLVRVLSNLFANCLNEIRRMSDKKVVYYELTQRNLYANSTRWITEPGQMEVRVQGKRTLVFTLEPGQVTTLLLTPTAGNELLIKQIMVRRKSRHLVRVHMLWQVPQYVLLTLGEVMIVITGLSFAYKEAPDSMKTVVVACFLLTMAVGNLVAFFLVGLRFAERQSDEYFLLAGLMFVGMVVFMLLACCYIPRKRRSGQTVIVGN